jgi:hypothetical protein
MPAGPTPRAAHDRHDDRTRTQPRATATGRVESRRRAKPDGAGKANVSAGAELASSNLLTSAKWAFDGNGGPASKAASQRLPTRVASITRGADVRARTQRHLD